jgi:hypothetical protein
MGRAPRPAIGPCSSCRVCFDRQGNAPRDAAETCPVLQWGRPAERGGPTRPIVTCKGVEPSAAICSAVRSAEWRAVERLEQEGEELACRYHGLPAGASESFPVDDDVVVSPSRASLLKEARVL